MRWHTTTKLRQRLFPERPVPAPATTDPRQLVLQVAGVGVTRGARTILNDVSFHVHAGEKIGLLGPNGSGKTSLLRVLAGMVTADQGQVRVFDRAIDSLGDRQRAHWVATVSQDEHTDLPFTARDVLLLGRTSGQPDWRPSRTEDHLEIEALAQQWDLEPLLDRPLQQMSGGERRRVLLARAFAQRTPVLLLDEPTNHLDLRHQHQLLSYVAGSTHTTVMALHDLDLAASYCSRLIVVSDARVVADGSPEEVLNAELISRVWQVSGRPMSVDGRTRVMIG